MLYYKDFLLWSIFELKPVCKFKLGLPWKFVSLSFCENFKFTISLEKEKILNTLIVWKKEIALGPKKQIILLSDAKLFWQDFMLF